MFSLVNSWLSVCLKKNFSPAVQLHFTSTKKKKEKTVLNHSNAIEELQYFSFNASCKYPVSIKSISLLVVCMLVCVWHVKPIVPIGMLPAAPYECLKYIMQFFWPIHSGKTPSGSARFRHQMCV